MSARTIRGSLKAYISEHSSIGPDELKNMPEEKLVRSLSYSMHDMTTNGWTLVGIAQLTVELAADQDIINGQVNALKLQKQQVLAKAEAESTRIERQIQSLLAISYEGGAA